MATVIYRQLKKYLRMKNKYLKGINYPVDTFAFIMVINIPAFVFVIFLLT